MDLIAHVTTPEWALLLVTFVVGVAVGATTALCAGYKLFRK